MTSSNANILVGSGRARDACGRVGLLLAAVLSIASIAGAQTTATLGGVVVDQTEAAVPAVTVTVRNVATGVQREVISGSDGRFSVPLLPPGTYSVGAQAAGFAPASIKSLVLNVGDQLNIRLRLQDRAARRGRHRHGRSPAASARPRVWRRLSIGSSWRTCRSTAGAFSRSSS